MLQCCVLDHYRCFVKVVLKEGEKAFQFPSSRCYNQSWALNQQDKITLNTWVLLCAFTECIVCLNDRFGRVEDFDVHTLLPEINNTDTWRKQLKNLSRNVMCSWTFVGLMEILGVPFLVDVSLWSPPTSSHWFPLCVSLSSHGLLINHWMKDSP